VVNVWSFAMQDDPTCPSTTGGNASKNVEPEPSLVSQPRPGGGARLLGSGSDAAYVYAAMSRRAGGASLGIDLTPGKECSLACVYCQVPRARAGPTRNRPAVDLKRLRRELDIMLRSPPDSGWADLAVAGSGEPTLALNFEQALDRILEASAEASFANPLRIYTNGLHLEKGSVRRALAKWTNQSGEVWVKLDALSDEMCAKLWRRKVTPAAHVARIWRFAEEQPIGIQTTIMRGEGMVCLETLAHQLAAVVSWGLALGAKFHGIQLVSPTRPAGDLAAVRAARLTPASRDELEVVARILETELGLPVQAFA